jgi:hypothetical protein
MGAAFNSLRLAFGVFYMNNTLVTETLYSRAPHRGWLPWFWLAPLICKLLVGLSSVPIDFLLEFLGLVDSKGDPLSAPAFCVFLFLPFAPMAVAVLAWTHLVERRTWPRSDLAAAKG